MKLDDELAATLMRYMPPQGAVEKWVDEKLPDIPAEYRPAVVDALVRHIVDSSIQKWLLDSTNRKRTAQEILSSRRSSLRA